MTFSEAIQTCIKEKYMDFEGRADRSEYWWFVLLQMGLMSVCSLLVQFSPNVGLILRTIVSLALFLPGLAVLVRRLHDINRSGWWILIAAIPVLGWIWLIVLTLLKGDEGPNDF